MKSYYLWGATLGVGLAAASCGITDVQPDGSGGLGGEAGASTGGHPPSGGSSSAPGGEGGLGGSATGTGGAATGGVGTGGVGIGGTGGVPWSPPESALSGTLEELEAMTCVIELDEGDDGTVDRRWGVDYAEQQVTRQLVWTPDGTISVVSFDESERPWLTCWPEGCDRVTYEEDPSDFDGDCPEGSAPTEGTSGAEVELYGNPPALPVATWAHNAYWLSPEGLPSRAEVEEDFESEWSCFFPDGTVSKTHYYLEADSDYSEEIRRATYYPNQQVAEWYEADDLGSWEQACNASGWQVSEHVIDLSLAYSELRTVTYEAGGGLGGAAGEADLVAQTVREYDDYRPSPPVVSDDIVSGIHESLDGLTYEISFNSPSLAQSGSFTLDRARGRPHVVDRLFDEAGRLLSEGVDVTVDGAADLENTYSYSEGCLPGDSPQLAFVPRTKDPDDDFAWGGCAFRPLPYNFCADCD